jgi:hypothetical protein
MRRCRRVCRGDIVVDVVDTARVRLGAALAGGALAGALAAGDAALAGALAAGDATLSGNRKSNRDSELGSRSGLGWRIPSWPLGSCLM